MIDVNTFLLLTGAIFVIGLLGEIIFSKTGIPDVIILLAIGMAVGPWLGLFEPQTLMSVAPFVAPIALMLILFESGLAMNFYKVIYQSPRALVLSVFNMALSIVFAAVAMNLSLGWDYLSGALLGAIVGGTSSVTVISLMKQVKPCDETGNVLVLESVITDALTVVTSIAIIEIIIAGGFIDPTDFAGDILGAFSIGAMFGIIGAVAWLYGANRIHVESPKPMLALASVALLYALTELLGGNGAISTLFFGIVLGNSTELANAFRMGPLRVDLSTIKLFQTEISLFVRTFFFVYLGAIFVAQDMSLIMIGMLVALALMFTRKFAVLAGVVGNKILWWDRHLIESIAPRGLAAAVVSQLPLSYGMPLARAYTDLVLAIIIGTTLYSSVMLWVWRRGKNNVCAIASADSAGEKPARRGRRQAR